METNAATVYGGLQGGQVRVLLGLPGGLPAAPEGWWVVRARCDGPPRLLGPIREAQAQVGRLVGSRTPMVELAADRVRTGLRRRLLGEESESGWPTDGDLVAELNRLAESVDGPSAIALEAVEAADAASLAFLQRVVRRPGWLRPALLLCFSRPPAAGPARDLLQTCELAGAIVLRQEVAAPSPPVLPPTAPGTRQVLRAAAVVGEGFEVELVAALLERSPQEVLLALQEAWDAGIPIEDLGEGRFHLPPPLAESLRAELLPSLRSAWNRRLAGLLDRASPTEAPAEPGPDPTAQGRAARHSAEAGDVDLAVQRYIQAARELSEQGATDQALHFAMAARELLDRLPATPERRHQAGRALAIIGRLRWESGSGEGETTLADAHKALSEALQMVSDSEDAALRAEIRRLRAGVAYDQGDAEHLDQALADLAEGARELQRAGESRAAARLLNDQAAVLVAMGDPVRAAHLLEESLSVFQSLSARAARDSRREGRALSEEEAFDRREVAETLHLMARLPLHVPARPGQEEEALRRAVEHAEEAAGIYAELGLLREQARVWQSEGQLLERAAESIRARDLLGRAARTQLNLGDAIGLARTTQAMAGLLGRRGEHAEALRLLVDSVRLNLGKGSPRGLAWNRRTLDELVRGMGEVKRQELAPMIVAVRRQLEGAEGHLGRVELPPPTG